MLYMSEITNRKILDRLDVKSRMFCGGVKADEILKEDIEVVITIVNKVYNRCKEEQNNDVE